MKSNTNNIRIVFRADGNSDIGLGHVFRLLSLIEIFKEQFSCLFIIQHPDEKLTSLIKEYCDLHVISGKNEEQDLSEILLPTDFFVLDGYQFNSTYQKFLKTLVYKLVVIDDKADVHFYADLVINHGGELIRDLYRKESFTKLLTGFKYLIVRKEFLNAALRKKVVKKVDTAYICFGGADPFNVTVKVLKAIAACTFIKRVIVVTGSAYRNKEEISALIDSLKHRISICHEENISATRMVELISESDLAICPASSVAMEVCCVKSGLLSGTVIDNQNGIHQQLLMNGCCVSIGNFNTASTEDIKNCLHQLSNVTTVNGIIQKQSDSIDGLSVTRIIEEFRQLMLC